MRDLHVPLGDDRHRKFKAAVKVLGYETMASYVREQVRAAIKQAENVERSEK
jgi:hypothetical protein